MPVWGTVTRQNPGQQTPTPRSPGDGMQMELEPVNRAPLRFNN